MDPELKAALDAVNAAFEEFKRTNDARLKAIETKGSAPADFEEKLAKINADIDAKLAEHKRVQDEIEKKLNRAQLGAPGGDAGAEKRAEQKAARLAYFRQGEVKTLVKSNDTGAGYLCGEEFDQAIIKAAIEVSPVRELVTVRPISKQNIKGPKLTSAPAMAQKTGETQARVESANPAYGLVDIPTHEFYAIHKVSHQQLEDSDYDVEAELAEFMGWQFGLREANDVIKGTGVGEARGILNAGLEVTNSGSATSIADKDGQADGLIDLVHAVKESYAKNGLFILNRKTLGSVRKLKDGNKQYIWQPGTAAGLPATILNYRYVEIGEMPDEGADATPIAFGDFKRGYRFHPRIQSSILRDPYSLSDSGLVKFTAYRRHGGDVVLAEAIRLLKCKA